VSAIRERGAVQRHSGVANEADKYIVTKQNLSVQKSCEMFGNETKSRVFVTATNKNVTTRGREVTKHASTPHNVIYEATPNEGEPRDELFGA